MEAKRQNDWWKVGEIALALRILNDSLDSWGNFDYFYNDGQEICHLACCIANQAGWLVWWSGSG